MPKKRDRRNKYHWLTMKVGQALQYKGKTRTGPYVLAARANARYPKLSFEGGYDEGGIGRVWRVK